MIGWLRRRAEYRTLIETDAKALIERFGEEAYSVKSLPTATPFRGQ